MGQGIQEWTKFDEKFHFSFHVQKMLALIIQ